MAELVDALDSGSSLGNQVEVRVLSSAPVPLARVATCFAILALLAFPAHADVSFGLEAYERGDFAGAFAEWQPAAEEGVVEAQYNLALLYYHGKGVAVDLELAHQWYLRAAQQDYLRAQYRVAEMFEKGEGVRKNLIQAYFWFKVAGDEKYSDARKRRRKVADRLTPEQIAYADMLARHRKQEAKEKK